MLAFLRWLRATFLGALSALARVAFMLVIILLAVAALGMFQGDGLPGNMVLTLDLRNSMPDSVSGSGLSFSRPVTVLDTVLALDAAERDGRVKGAVIRIGSGSVSVAEAEELGTAIRDFRKAGKFVYVHSQGFNSPGMGDYRLAASADQIWMQPLSPFSTSGTAASEIFLRGLFDKFGAEPQIVKRAEYKSAADTFMEKAMTEPDREQLSQLLTSVHKTALAGIAADRRLTEAQVIAALNVSPQLTEDAVRAKLADRVGYDDDTQAAALGRAGQGATATRMSDYIKASIRGGSIGSGPTIAVVTASGEIMDGSAAGGFGTSSVIAGDDMAAAIREATKDSQIRAILVRVDSPGGSVAASDQILDALRKAKARGKPIVISMASVAASGGYYISAYADRIIAQPATITGSIGVLTGKVSIGKSLAMIGVVTEEISIGNERTLMNSPFMPYGADDLAAVNRQADSIYADFTRKVAEGRKMPLAKVQDVARGRVWSGADAKAQGLVDLLGGFWTAAAEAKKLAKIDAAAAVTFKQYPRPKGLMATVDDLFGSTSEVAQAMQGVVRLINSGTTQALIGAAHDLPRGDVELRATGLPGKL